MNRFFICMALLCLGWSLYGQETPSKQAPIAPACGTLAPSPEQYAFTRDVVSQIPVNRNAGTTAVPIQIHIVQDGGSGGPSLEDLAKALANLNNFYLDAGIEFFYKAFPNYVNDADLYVFNGFDDDVDGNDSESDLINLFTTATDAVNIYFVNSIKTGSGFGACGYAYFPANATYSNRIVMANGCLLNGANGTFVHEFGHYFNLYHTHQGTENGNTHPNAENVARTGMNANCSTDGDLLCDTEADPRYDSNNFNSGTCSIPNPGTDQVGDTYDPPIDNVMSYYPDGCGGIFTADQYTRIAQGLTTRQSHTAYDLNASPASVAVASGLTGVVDEINSEVDLSWTDNANNEMGYIVERSTTSSTAGFIALTNKGTGANATTLSDNTVMANTTYWYRIKATNGGKDDYSNVVEVAVGLIYCGIGSGVCDEYISRVQMGSIDNTSMCTAGGYQNYTNLSTNVETGADYSITVNNPAPYTGDECGIFVDWNQDGDFDDADESIAVSGGPGTFTATITPPDGALSGATRMRIRITYNKTPTSCGIDTYGETEDYTLNVMQILPVEYLSFSAFAKSAFNELEWVTATEKNNEVFVVERLDPGTNRFQPVGEIGGAGDSEQALRYDWKDWTPLAGTNYYRLKQVDYDGRFEYSSVVNVNWKTDEELTMNVFPNPVWDEVFVHTNRGISNAAQIHVLSSMGQKISLEVRSLASNQLSLNVAHLPKGVYYLVLTEDGQPHTGKKFIKK